MKLYAMSCGRLRCRKKIFVPDADAHDSIDCPMPIFLISHPKGNVLFDTGPHPVVFNDPVKRWGKLSKVFEPIGNEKSSVLSQLEELNTSPTEVKYVVNSHLHFDHAGGNEFFDRSTFLVSKAEMETANNPENEGKGYFRNDWDHPLRYSEIDGEVDIYGDGRLTIIPAPGHTPGHQILLVRLKDEGTVILSGDSVPCIENFEDLKLPRNNVDDALALRTIRKLREAVEREQALLIHGHDPFQWEKIRKVPRSYT